MARPKKEIAERQDKRFPTVRCTSTELSNLRDMSQKAQMTLSEFIRQKSLKGKIVIKKSANPMNFSLIHELNKIGTNLNQIAKKANSTGEISTSIKMVNEKIEQVLDRILTTIPISNDSESSH